MRKFVMNETIKLRRNFLMTLVKLFEEGKLIENLPKLNITLLGEEARYRESIYLEREVLKQRIKLYLGLDYEKYKDMELYEIVNIFFDKENNKINSFEKSEKMIQVINEACDQCPSGKYYITEMCRNCLAHSCMNVCPKNAISIINNRAIINSEKCVGCGLCKNECSYYAVVKLERPCRVSCPVDAISMKNTKIQIDYDKCISCGACFVACPFGAIETPSQVIHVLNLLNNNENLAIMFAPSIVSQFGPIVNEAKIKSALRKLGFTVVYELAKSADIIAKEEAEFIENADKLITSSCCPSFVEYIEKHNPEFIKNISPSLSPMAEAGKLIKEEEKDIKTVFVGPCISKKKEALNSKYIDYVITFPELAALFIAKKIEPSECKEENLEGSFEGWNFAASQGVTNAIKHYSNKEISSMSINGIEEAKKIFALSKVKNPDFIEGMACEGGCICGPEIMINPNLAKKRLEKIK